MMDSKDGYSGPKPGPIFSGPVPGPDGTDTGRRFGLDSGKVPFRPLYQQVKEHLIRRVVKGEWRPGEMLPSEKELAVEYGLSQGTVRKAVAEMFDEGLVTRRAGRGTFVTSHEGEYKPPSFHPFYTNDGARIAEDSCLYLQCTNIPATGRVAEGLQIQPGTPVSEIVRLRRSGGWTAVVERTYLPDELCPDAYAVVQRERPRSLYLLLEKTYNILIIRVEERVRARIVTDSEAALLEIDTGGPILEVERTAFSLGGLLIEWRTMICDTASCYYFRH